MHVRQLPVWAALALLFIAAGPAAAQPDCKALAAAPAPGSGKCTCDLAALRPLQMAAGLGEVAKKQKDIEKDLGAELQVLEKDPIKIVRGFGGNFFVVDHHHGALAFIKAFEALQRPGPANGTCELFAKLPADGAFWRAVQQPVRGQVVARFADENGVPFAKAQLQAKLPPTLKQMSNDPYRTLAWMLRKQDGFCRKLMAQSDFAEFQWADWMRSRPELPAGKVRAVTDPKLWTDTKKKDREEQQEDLLMTAKALALAKNAGARQQPGYNGDARLSGAACNPKDDG